ncbi:MAG: branched-chain amino acid ABC transporter permease, partial [Clostridia bacterium]|nr:branched-chain amino acid ABC transporter permease [Clostridia bacterium]
MNKTSKFKLKHYINYIAIAIFTVVFAVLSMSNAMPSSNIILVEKIAIAIILAVSLSMVVGFLGELSLGHAGFM